MLRVAKIDQVVLPLHFRELVSECPDQVRKLFHGLRSGMKIRKHFLRRILENVPQILCHFVDPARDPLDLVKERNGGLGFRLLLGVADRRGGEGVDPQIELVIALRPHGVLDLISDAA